MTHDSKLDMAPAKHWIAGAWVGDGQGADSISPSTGEVLGSYIDADPDVAARAIKAARTAFDTTDWARDRAVRSRALTQLATGSTSAQRGSR